MANYNSTQEDYSVGFEHPNHARSANEINQLAISLDFPQESIDPKDSTLYLLRSTSAHILNRRALLSYRGVLGLVRLFYNVVMFIVFFGLTIDVGKQTCKSGLYWPVTYLIVTALAILQLAPHTRGITTLDKFFFGFWTKQRVLSVHQLLALLFVLVSIILPFTFTQTVPKCPIMPQSTVDDTLGYNKYVYNFSIAVTVFSYLEVCLFTPFFMVLLHFGYLDYILRYSPLHSGVSTETIVKVLPSFTYHDENDYLSSRLNGLIPMGLPLIHDQPQQIGPLCLCCHKHYFLGDDLIRLGCGHDGHAACIQRWLKVENCCPTCQLNAIPFEHLDPSRDYNETSGILGAAGPTTNYTSDLAL